MMGTGWDEDELRHTLIPMLFCLSGEVIVISKASLYQSATMKAKPICS
jgi:hypothetical protein